MLPRRHSTLGVDRSRWCARPSSTTANPWTFREGRHPYDVEHFDCVSDFGGATGKIADRIASVLRGRSDTVEVCRVETAPALDAYDGVVVVGDSIHAVKHSKAMIRYLEAHVDVLNSMPSALFQVCLTSANPNDEHTATAHALVEALLERNGFDPDVVGLFAGASVYTQYGGSRVA